ncbi:MAG: hypothetical protein KJ601_01785, partial [Nanoarchaeota archaeon]|nr:hypothetical protein [Nanoarchaeota archaeon]
MPAQPLPIRKWEEFRDKYNELLRLTLSEKDKIKKLIRLLETERQLTLEFLSHLEEDHFSGSDKVKALLHAMKQNLNKAIDRCIMLKRIVYKEKDYENDLMLVKLQNMRAWKEQRILKLAERSQYNLHQFNVEADEV